MHHALEFSAGDDHAQGGARAQCWLYCRHQAGRSDALFSIGSRGISRACWRAPRRPQYCHRVGQGDRRRTDFQSHRSQALVHRLHRSWENPDGPVREHDQKTLSRIGRERSFHRFSTMRISTPRSKARLPPSTATPARPAFAPTVCWCRTASTMFLQRSSPPL